MARTYLLSALFCLLALAGWAGALRWAPLNVDAGLYLSLSREAAGGEVLYRDLACDYPPAFIELLALAGQRTLRDPLRVKAIVYALHVASALLIYRFLRNRGHERELAVLAAAMFAVWVFACDGTAVVLEGGVNLALLIGLAAVAIPSRLAPSALAGLACGIALMMKQYAIVGVPAIAILALLRDGRASANMQSVAAPSISNTDPEMPESGATEESRTTGRRQPSWAMPLLCFLIAITLPAVVYPLLRGFGMSGIAELILHWSTFGDRLDSYEQAGLRGMFVALTEGGPATALLPFLVLGAALIIFGDWRQIVLGGTLFLSALPLAVRDYPHYVQLAVPWAVLVAAELSALLARRLGQPSRAALLLTLMALPLVPLLPAAGGVLYRQARDDELVAQQLLARKAAEQLPTRDDVLVINAAWLYPLADLRAPAGDYRFLHQLPGTAEADPDTSPRELRLREIALSAGGVEGRIPVDEAVAWLVAGGLRVISDGAHAGVRIVLLERPGAVELTAGARRD